MITLLEEYEQRIKSIDALKRAKQQELNRKLEGYVWVTKDKIAKQVSICVLSDLLNIGWVKCNKQNT